MNFLGLLSTSPPPEHPDLGPGEGQQRDAALAATASATTSARPLPAQGVAEGELQAGDDLDAAIAEARRGHVLDGDLQVAVSVLHDPLEALEALRHLG